MKRVLWNGDIMYTSAPYPTYLEGYIRDEHNIGLWHPITMACSERVESTQRKQCGAIHREYICLKKKANVIPSMCATCPDRDDKPERVYDLMDAKQSDEFRTIYQSIFGRR